MANKVVPLSPKTRVNTQAAPSSSNARGAALGECALLNAISSTVIAVDENNEIQFINTSGEVLFRMSATTIIGQHLDVLIPIDHPINGLVSQVRASMHAMSEFGVRLESPKIGKHFVNVQANPIAEIKGGVAITLQERTIADQINHRMVHRGAARSISAMGAMLAHEVKNPLSGIRGAAQLLEQSASEEDHTLTKLIRDETDRICALVDRMEVFSEDGLAHTEDVNIHQVLNHVVQLAAHGFGRHVRIVERYDPSLPHLVGNRDQLIQVFINLVKNACEAAPQVAGEIVLSTAYRHGVRFAVPGSKSKIHVPLMVSIQDNGAGISEDMQAHLFDPFITSKPKGSGLGLAMTAKIINDHGGVIDFETESGRTVFKVMLPLETNKDKPQTPSAQETSVK